MYSLHANTAETAVSIVCSVGQKINLLIIAITRYVYFRGALNTVCSKIIFMKFRHKMTIILQLFISYRPMCVQNYESWLVVDEVITIINRLTFWSTDYLVDCTLFCPPCPLVATDSSAQSYFQRWAFRVMYRVKPVAEARMICQSIHFEHRTSPGRRSVCSDHE